jgi:hypothetical protein
MSDKTIPTRRGFLKGSAMVAGPLAAMAPAAAIADDGLRARAARLEDEAAIHRLQQDFLRQVSLAGSHEKLDGAVRAITADHTGATEEIAISADGRQATARLASLVEIETELAKDNTLAQMAHIQGSGSIRRTERRVLTTRYTRTRDGWTMDEAALA